jgi:hypothetical protein
LASTENESDSDTWAMKSAKFEDLSQAVSHVLEECRMVLPGIQALFGFQLIAVFNQRFKDIPPVDQILHLIATGLIALSAGLVMTPAAFHREVEPSSVSERFLLLATRLVLGSMGLLALGISIDFYIIARMVLQQAVAAIVIALSLFIILAAMWFVFPYCCLRGRR